MAISMLVRGKSREQVAEKLSMTPAEVFRIEEAYYSAQEMLSEHAMLMKQLARLEMVIDVLFDRVTQSTFDLNPDFVKHLLSAIDSVSDLAGLKKQKIQAEVRVINERQVPIVINYVDFVTNHVLDKVRPYLTGEGVKELTDRKNDWLSEATTLGANIIDEPTAVMTV